MKRQNTSKVRKVTSRGTPSYQLGHYEMKGEKGKRRSVFKVNVHLGQYESVEEALTNWPEEIESLRRFKHSKQADKLQEKLDKLRQLTRKEGLAVKV
jgi:hypothetical protein